MKVYLILNVPRYFSPQREIYIYSKEMNNFLGVDERKRRVFRYCEIEALIVCYCRANNLKNNIPCRSPENEFNSDEKLKKLFNLKGKGQFSRERLARMIKHHRLRLEDQSWQYKEYRDTTDFIAEWMRMNTNK